MKLPLFAALMFSVAAFKVTRNSLPATGRPAIVLKNSFVAEIFDPVKSSVQGYVDIWIPLFKQVKETGVVPEQLIHWGHGSAMLTVLIFMGGIGSFLGWQIRNGNGDEQYWFTLGKTAREQHPLIMGLAMFFFLLGGQGGLVLLAVQGQPILESQHALSAAVSIALLLLQATLPLLFKYLEGESALQARRFHAHLGTVSMATLAVMAVNGLRLGWSF